LMVDVPPKAQMLPQWFPNSAPNSAAMNTHEAEIDIFLQLSHASLHEVVSWLSEHDVLVVAAAGNDGLSGGHPEERLPARYDMDPSPPSVIGVAAVTNSSTAAAYSNRGDSGVVVLGGDATYSGLNEPPAVKETPQRDKDAVIGIYSSRVFPFADTPGDPARQNQTGWAFWSGTSFATPVISALAANRWLADPTASAVAIRNQILTQATMAATALGANAIVATQLPDKVLGIGMP